MINLNPGTASRWGINFLALFGAVLALSLGQQIFIPTVIALFLAALLWPFVNGLHRGLRLPWTLASLIGVLGLVLINLLVTAQAFWSVFRVVQDVPNPRDQERQEQVYRNLHAQLKAVSPLLVDEQYFPEDPQKSSVFQYLQGLQETKLQDLVVCHTSNLG